MCKIKSTIKPNFNWFLLLLLVVGVPVVLVAESSVSTIVLLLLLFPPFLRRFKRSRRRAKAVSVSLKTLYKTTVIRLPKIVETIER
eukprot:UN09993